MPRPLVLLALLFLSCNKLTNPFEGCAGLGLGSSGSLEGRLHDDTGSPVPNAAITLGMNRQTTTDNDGRFLFADVPGGTYTLTYTPVSSPVSGQIHVTSGRNVIDFVLPSRSDAGWATGRVLDACSGHPVAGATVGSSLASTVSGADGTYTLFVCCSSANGQTVSKDGYVAQPFSIGRVFHQTVLQDFILERAK